MSDTLKVFCTNLGEYLPIKGGETLCEIYDSVRDRIGMTPICAHVNNTTEDLMYPVFGPKMVTFLDSGTPSGKRVYERSLCMMLYKAVTEILPGMSLRIEHSVAGGLYCRLFSGNSELHIPGKDEISSLLKKMRDLRDANLKFIRKERLTTDVKEKFRDQGLEDKVLLLDTIHELYTVFYRLDGLNDSYYGALAPSTGLLTTFDLQPYKEGFLMLGRDPQNPECPCKPIAQEKMYQAFTDYLRFNRVIKISNVGELNMAVRNRQTADLINVAEAMHGKLLGKIADEIAHRHEQEGTSVVLIAGPSSSGKTTSAKRLGIQLMTNLLVPKSISLDDYFVDRVNTPRDETGDYDYESLYALDLERFNSDLNALFRGEEINLPTYSFELGQRIERERPLKLEKNDILLIEGIHGLNPELTSGIPAGRLFKVYVSALTTLSIDDHNWIPTTDNRLLRRIVRDHKYRHISALDTIRRWPSVRRGEEKWIFPYQENADAMFNSSLIFELGVMRDYAVPLLRNVPHDAPEYSEAYRLLRFLSYFEPIPSNQIPATSLLREFLGGSSFRY